MSRLPEDLHDEIKEMQDQLLVRVKSFVQKSSVGGKGSEQHPLVEEPLLAPAFLPRALLSAKLGLVRCIIKFWESPTSIFLQRVVRSVKKRWLRR